MYGRNIYYIILLLHHYTDETIRATPDHRARTYRSLSTRIEMFVRSKIRLESTTGVMNHRLRAQHITISPLV